MADQSDGQGYFAGLGRTLLGQPNLNPMMGAGLGATLAGRALSPIQAALQQSAWRPQIPGRTPAPPASAENGPPVEALPGPQQPYPQRGPQLAGAPNPEPGDLAHDQALADEFYQQYGPILKAGNIDIQQQMQDAKGTSFPDFVKNSETGHVWDYKNDKVLNEKVPDKDLLQRFGNVHFGMMAAARGMPLWEPVQGAGLYQTFSQDKNPLRGLSSGAVNTLPLPVTGIPMMAWEFPEEAIRTMAGRGFQFGDNPGDTNDIIKGYDYYRALQALQNH